jgi:hypothetical protein
MVGEYWRGPVGVELRRGGGGGAAGGDSTRSARVIV